MGNFLARLAPMLAVLAPCFTHIYLTSTRCVPCTALLCLHGATLACIFWVTNTTMAGRPAAVGEHVGGYTVSLMRCATLCAPVTWSASVKIKLSSSFFSPPLFCKSNTFDFVCVPFPPLSNSQFCTVKRVTAAKIRQRWSITLRRFSLKSSALHFDDCAARVCRGQCFGRVAQRLNSPPKHLPPLQLKKISAEFMSLFRFLRGVKPSWIKEGNLTGRRLYYLECWQSF